MFILSLPAEYVVFRDSPEWAIGFQAVLDDLGMSRDIFAGYVTVLDIINVGVPGLLAIVIFRRRSNDWLALLISATTVTYGSSITLAFFLTAPTVASVARILMDGLIVAVLCLFPDGRFIPPWTRWLVAVVFILGISDYILFQSPGAFSLGAIGYPIATFALFKRYRQPDLTPIQRQQIKWVLWGFIIAFLAYSIHSFIPAVFPSLASIHSEHPVYTLPSLLTFMITIALRLSSAVIFVVALSVSIVRYRLWDIDLAINRSLVYGIVTVGLGAIFVLIFLLAQAVLGTALGQDQASLSGAIAAVTSIVLFNPTRKYVRHFVDRQLYGFRFDLNELNDAQRSPKVNNPGALTGRTLGSYQVLGVLGKGGMGEVYQGQSNGQMVAIKILPEDLAQQPEFLSRFVREAKTLMTLKHPNIVSVFDSGTSDGIHYIVMEFVDGLELNDVIRQRGRLPLDEVRSIIASLAAALDYAHELGFVHRDIKPSNVMLRNQLKLPTLDTQSRPGQTILTDFGIAKVQDAQTRYTSTGAIGTIDYMAPEQIMAAREVDRHADVYALGVMVYEMLTGDRPFKGSAGQVLFAHLQQQAPDPRDILPDLSPDVAKAILKALEKNPEARFQSAGEFALALA